MADYEYWRRVESNVGFRKVEGFLLQSLVVVTLAVLM